MTPHALQDLADAMPTPPSTRRRRALNRLAVWIAMAGVLVRDVCFALAAEIYWLGARKARRAFEAKQAELQDQIAQAFVDALANPEPAAEYPTNTDYLQ